jgi:prepilin-type N-terminal cleavage/methylation domain-containing protein
MSRTILEDRSGRRRAFTLVEILIVVIILGILAAITLVMVSGATRDARRVTAVESQRVVTSAIELYRLETGRLPDILGPDWTPLTTETTIGLMMFGPYLHSEPKNPLALDPESLIDSADPVAYTNIAAFYYDYNGGNGSGRFIASLEVGP